MYEELWETFFLRTSRTSEMSPFFTFEFENIISYIKILCSGLISPPPPRFFLTNFKFPFFMECTRLRFCGRSCVRGQKFRPQLGVRSKVLFFWDHQPSPCFFFFLRNKMGRGFRCRAFFSGWNWGRNSKIVS